METIIDLIAELRKDNPDASECDLRIYADSLTIYLEASSNVAKNGAVCSHPRTGAPLENPYLKIMNSQSAVLRKMRWIESKRILQIPQP